MMKLIYNLLYSMPLVVFSMIAQAQVKMGNNPKVINSNAVLEMESTNKGMLLPRVALTGTANVAPLTTHIAGMVVYNTATVDNVSPGYYYNDGTQWVRLAATSNVSLPNQSLTNATTPAGNAVGQTAYNTNAGSGLPVGPVYWNGNTWVSLSPSATNNIYNTDGTLASNRTVGQGANTLNFTGTGATTFNSGNVGIGTTTPRESFDIRKGFTFHTGGNLAMAMNSYYNNGWKFGGYVGTGYAGLLGFNPATGDMNFVTSDAAGAEGTAITEENILTLKQSGNVGIGTTAPNAKLEVQGLGTASTARFVSAFNAGEKTEVILGGGNPHWGHITYNNINNSNDARLSLGALGAEHLTIDVAGAYFGNVGIGTTAPLEKIDVRDGAIQAKQTIDYNTAGTKDLLTLGLNKNTSDFNQITSYVWQAEKGANATSIKLNLLSQAADGSYGSNYDNATVTRTPAMTFYNGNVGIGTTAPDSKLQITGSAMSTNIETQELVRFQRDGVGGVRNGTSSGIRTGSFETGISGRGRMDLMVSGWPVAGNNWGSIPNINVMSLNGDGNVGIGTTAPNAKLEVNGGVFANGAPDVAYFQGLDQGYFQPGNTSATLIRGTNGAGIWLDKYSSNNAGGLSFRTHTTFNTPVERMRITDGGNIGVGTTTPTVKLEVNGYIKVGSTDIYGDGATGAPVGTIRYNSITDKFQGMISTGWVDLH
jgi:hypothetical protein